ncbi:uracil-DNA glycosylase family protein [Porticoccaceae bacterium]|nr:uracil-DNA glycosylase family protein [Porticoccaceae bacterium]
MTRLRLLAEDIRRCQLCEPELPFGARPVLQVSPQAKILIAGQAPGRKVHASGIPFDDPSGDRLRDWLGVTPEQFYNPELFAIVPMGFCYPGTGKSGDLPPRPECAITWRAKLLQRLPNIQTTLVIGKYAHDYHFSGKAQTVTALVKDWCYHWPGKIPLPHPSPRNNLWLRKNPWFDAETVPEIQRYISALLAA